MKTLVYGFKPYKKYEDNISEKVVGELKGKNLVKTVFDVKFNEKQFVSIVRKFKPDAVLGLGQHPRSKKIRIERKAKKEDENYLLNLKLKKDKCSWISYDAGKYVCNYSMWVLANNFKGKLGFIHLPKNYNLNEAVKFVEEKLKEIR